MFGFGVVVRNPLSIAGQMFGTSSLSNEKQWIQYMIWESRNLLDHVINVANMKYVLNIIYIITKTLHSAYNLDSFRGKGVRHPGPNLKYIPGVSHNRLLF